MLNLCLLRKWTRNKQVGDRFIYLTVLSTYQFVRGNSRMLWTLKLSSIRKHLVEYHCKTKLISRSYYTFLL